MASLIVLDTSVLIPLAGGQSKFSNGRERILAVLRYHREQGDSVAIPAPAFAECCHCSEPLIRQMIVPPLNVAAAEIANRITPATIATATSHGCLRQAAKMDALIMAIAEERGATLLYAEDPWFKEVAVEAKLRVKILEPPEPPAEQLSLIASELVPPS